MNFKDFKKQTKTLSVEDVKKNIKDATSNNFTKRVDPRFWSFQLEDNKGFAKIRFLPSKNPTATPIQPLFTHYIKMKDGRTEIIPCMKSYNESCPICKYASSFYSSNYEIYKNWKAKKRFISNVIIVKDSEHAKYDEENDEIPPTIEDVKLFSYGIKIKDMLNSIIAPEDEDETPENLFGFEKAKIFKLSSKNIDQYPDYTNSKVLPEEFEIEEDKQEMIFEKMFDLQEVAEEKKIEEKELKEILQKIIEEGKEVEESDEESKETEEYKLTKKAKKDIEIEDEEENDDELDALLEGDD